MPGLDDFSRVSGAAVLGRELPYSQEAEEAVLGCILYDPVKCMPVCVSMLKPESFYRPQHQQLFSIFLTMFSTGRSEDMVVAVDEAVSMGVFETAKAAKTYLMGLMDNVISTGNIDRYCKIVADKAQLRALITVANDIIEASSTGAVDAAELLDTAEQKIYDIRSGKNITGLTKISDVIVETFQHLSEISGENRKEFLGATTGFSQLDQLITGLNRTDLLVLAARPGVGKSAFALNIAVNTCKSNHRDVAIFSLEMGKEQLVSRMLASEGKVNNTLLRSGEMQDDDWNKIAEAADVLSHLPIYIDDTGGITVPQMKAKLRKLKNLGLVIVDYIQLMETANKHNSRVNEVSEITRQLKLMAKELNVPVLALSQLSRKTEAREDKRPLMSDLRESGSIEQDADIIMFLYREVYYNENTENRSETECIVAKNRHGERSTVKLSWMAEYTLFRGMEFKKDDK